LLWGEVMILIELAEVRGRFFDKLRMSVAMADKNCWRLLI